MEPDMIVDCDRCAVRGGACQDCVITVLLGAPAGGVELDGAEWRALDTLAEAGLVPRLQLVECHKDHKSTPTGIDTAAHLHKSVERCGADGKRSRRHVS
jgi:hypothetical protein